jgi:hypothetical protein
VRFEVRTAVTMKIYFLLNMTPFILQIVTNILEAAGSSEKLVTVNYELNTRHLFPEDTNQNITVVI